MSAVLSSESASSPVSAAASAPPSIEKALGKLDAQLSKAAAARVFARDEAVEAAWRNSLWVPSDASGFALWKPEGALLYEKLRALIRSRAKRFGAQEVKSPILAPCALFQRSGHLEKYADYMFFANAQKPAARVNGQVNDAPPGAAPAVEAGSALALRPMSCPNHIAIYASERRSWRELPLRLFEFGEVFRDEASGALQGLFRARQFCQDDWHIFMAPGQEAQEAANWLAMSFSLLDSLGFSAESRSVRISLRPEQRLGDDAAWDRAENALRASVAAAGLAWEEEEGGGAFYGPKIELHARDARGRSWQLGVFQLDCALPERFGLQFDAAEGIERPVLAHAAGVGSLERMIGVLLEGFGRNLPLALQPHEAVVIPVSQHQDAGARAVLQAVQEAFPDAQMDLSSASLSSKIARARSSGRPFELVVGDVEVQVSAAVGEPCANINGALVRVSAWIQALRGQGV